MHPDEVWHIWATSSIKKLRHSQVGKLSFPFTNIICVIHGPVQTWFQNNLSLPIHYRTYIFWNKVPPEEVWLLVICLNTATTCWLFACCDNMNQNMVSHCLRISCAIPRVIKTNCKSWTEDPNGCSLCVSDGGVVEVLAGTGSRGVSMRLWRLTGSGLRASVEHRDTMFVAYVTAVTTHQ